MRFALATASAAAGVTSLHAQEAPAPAAAPVEEVVVTGSRLQTPNEQSISPITSVSATDLQATGLTRVEDVLNNLPMVFAGQNSTVSNGSDGTATVDLRGLGPQRTVVLVNGRRLGPGFGDGRSFSDLNQIPSALIERVDILTGGASAVYGADAVAGVVNFILNTKFQGVRVDAGYDFYQHHNSNSVASVVAAAGDTLPPGNVNTGFAKQASVLLGSNFADDRGNATLYATWDKQAAVLQSKYDYSSCNLQDRASGALRCGGSGTSAKNGAGGYFQAYGNAPGPALFTNTVDGATGAWRPFDFSNDLYNFGPLNFYRVPQERYTGGAFVSFDVNPHLQAYGEVMTTRNHSVAQIAPSGDFFVPKEFIPCNDPLLTPAERASICAAAAAQGNPVNPVNAALGTGAFLYIGRRNAEGGGRQATFTNTAFRTVLGLKGDIGDAWKFDIYAQRGTVDNNNGNLNYFSNANILNALNVVPGPTGPQCAVGPPCVPWNIWVPNGVTKAATDYLSIPLLVEADTTEEIVSGSITGDLGKYNFKLPTADDGIQVALGAEWRSENADFRPDLESQLGNAAGSGGPTKPVYGSFHVKEAFTEARVPIMEHAPGADELNLEAGYRYSDYSEGFKTNTYKVGLEWAPVHALRLRGSYQRAVRAPNILELYLPAAVVLDGTTDPCAGATPVPSAAQCAAAGVSAAQYGHIAPNAAAQYNGFTGGNPNLQPEKSDTYSVGFIFQPTFVANLMLSVDYYNIKVKDTIGPIGADTIIANCVATGNPIYCSAVHRDATGSLWRTPNGFITDTNVNFGSLGTKGVDVKVNYRVPMATLGSIAFALEGTRESDLTVQPLTNGPSYSCTGFFGARCGAPSPKWRHVLNTTWSTPWDAMDLTLRWRYLGEADSEFTSGNPQLAGKALPLTSHIPTYNYIDLSAAFAITKIVRLQLGVNNITDKDPPIIDSGGGGFGSNCPNLSGIGGASSCNGNTWPGVYDALGRYIYGRITATF
ncbi:MAG: TonB-dependent receptor [Gammaproteobacteria bacterium]|nr:TonB-dependent receptor [Gammaproteobacteria bacterium]